MVQVVVVELTSSSGFLEPSAQSLLEENRGGQTLEVCGALAGIYTLGPPKALGCWSNLMSTERKTV